MAKNYEENSDAVNRCERCNRPLSDPTADYGWWRAKLLGLGDYVRDEKLDYDDLSVYNDGKQSLISRLFKLKSSKNPFVDIAKVAWNAFYDLSVTVYDIADETQKNIQRSIQLYVG